MIEESHSALHGRLPLLPQCGAGDGRTGEGVLRLRGSSRREKAQPFAGAYYYVPSIFVDGTKVYEAKPGESYEECKQHVETAFRAAVEQRVEADG